MNAGKQMTTTLLAAALALASAAGDAGDLVGRAHRARRTANATVRPKATDEVLINPDMGFVYYHYSNRLWAYGINTANGDRLDGMSSDSLISGAM